MRELLMESQLALSSFRWRIRQAGYPIKEPPRLDSLLQRIDSAVFPEFNPKKRGPKPKTTDQPCA